MKMVSRVGHNNQNSTGTTKELDSNSLVQQQCPSQNKRTQLIYARIPETNVGCIAGQGVLSHQLSGKDKS